MNGIAPPNCQYAIERREIKYHGALPPGHPSNSIYCPFRADDGQQSTKSFIIHPEWLRLFDECILCVHTQLLIFFHLLNHPLNQDLRWTWIRKRAV